MLRQEYSRSLLWRRQAETNLAVCLLHMANTTTRAKDQKVSALDLHCLLALHTDYDIGMAPSMLLYSWLRDGPRDYFTTTSGFPKTSSLTDPHSLKQETDSMYLSRERTDSEKAVKGSDDEPRANGRVGFQHDTLKNIAGHIPSENSEELRRRGKEAEVRTFRSHCRPFCYPNLSRETI